MAEKSHTKPWQRITVLVIAILFILTSATLTISVIIQAVSKDDSSSTNSSQDATDAKTVAGTKLKGFKPVESVSELQKTDLKKGDGPTVKADQTVTVEYTGALAKTGVIFQSTKDMDQPAVTFPLNGVIKGWQKGIPGMKVGGQRQLVIPAELAYGEQSPQGSGIPPNSPLVFNITLLKIDE